MRSVKIIIGICLFVICNSGFAINLDKKSLCFAIDGTFKIVQFTDIHWKSGLEWNKMTTLSMEIILDKEKPDFVVLTGDIVEAGDIAKGWAEVVAPIIQRKIAWAVVLGNHDSEGKQSRKEVYDTTTSLEYNVSGEMQDNLSGVGNFSIPIRSSENKNATILYFFDSHAYATPNMPGNYDWMKHDQLAWYKKLSSEYTKQNHNQPLPSVAFFHIPLPEYKEVMLEETTLGQRNEGVASPLVNSGLFSAMLEMRDIIGIFVGHNHNNDFIGIHNNIAMAYGRCSGSNAYGKLRIGARVIQLFQDEFHFSSWIVTPSGKEKEFIYPSKDLIQPEDAELMPAIQLSKNLKPGVGYHYYEGKIKSVHQIKNLQTIKSGTLNNFSLVPAQSEDHFAFQFNSYLKIPEDGMYQFYLDSDDGAILSINNQPVIDNDGSHAHMLKKVIVGLKKGYHKLDLMYFEDCASNRLRIGIESLAIRRSLIPDSMLFTEE